MAEQTGEVKNREWRGKVGKMMEDEFAAFLAGNPFCRIGCVDEEGWPYVVPCCLSIAMEDFTSFPGRSRLGRGTSRRTAACSCVSTILRSIIIACW